ncbi:hypothetical protein GOP47_0022673 [Adiantum capillus-veneris]|uniref:Phytocyanin domain-containing protein n=1 Tax=Adiantum capillus-veneris TaxID=13818 RepID=A0A9D4U5T6_ADICA|nr:hypothetical protein GOP47_0022673 [Adiantum capillus-veneris]
MEVLQVVLVVSLCYVGPSAAATYKVGDAAGWNLDVDFQGWADAHQFSPGDVLEFDYSPDEHNVVEVMEGEFEQCTTSNPITFRSSGADRITLDKSGTRYFLCGAPGHCPAGMKFSIVVS